MNMTHEETATRLRSALIELTSYSDSDYFSGLHGSRDYSISETLALLDKDFPVFSDLENHFISVASKSTGWNIVFIKEFVKEMKKGIHGDDTRMRGASELYDHWVTFNAAYEYAVREHNS